MKTKHINKHNAELRKTAPGAKVSCRKIPKKCHKMEKNQNFENILKISLDIPLKIIFSKH